LITLFNVETGLGYPVIMTVVRQRCFPGQAAGESPYENNEEEVEEEGDWKVEE
jgi:K+-transporting ATPase c subunit